MAVIYRNGIGAEAEDEMGAVRQCRRERWGRRGAWIVREGRRVVRGGGGSWVGDGRLLRREHGGNGRVAPA